MALEWKFAGQGRDGGQEVREKTWSHNEKYASSSSSLSSLLFIHGYKDACQGKQDIQHVVHCGVVIIASLSSLFGDSIIPIIRGG